MINIRYTVMALCITALSSCSVKEDRMVCPCSLTEEFCEVSRKQTTVLPWVSLRGTGGGSIMQDFVHPGMLHAGRKYVVKVPKEQVDVTVVCGMERYSLSDDGSTLVLGTGSEADSLYIHTVRLDCIRENVSDTVRPYKQWCTLDVRVEGTAGGKKYHYEIEGNWNGLSTMDLTPAEGRLRCRPRDLGDGMYQARIPRQGDDSLMLMVYDTDESGLPGDLAYGCPIGEYLAVKGYDWKKKGLDDVIVTIDHAKTDVRVEIAPWDHGESYYDITI